VILAWGTLAAAAELVEVGERDGEAFVVVREGDRRGVFVASPSGDDLYLLWLETTTPPARDPRLPPCDAWARALEAYRGGAPPKVSEGWCAGEPPSLERTRSVRVRRKRGELYAIMPYYRMGTEQWVWQPVPAQRVTDTPPEVLEGLPGWALDAAAWGVGVPLFLPEPVGVVPMRIVGHRGSPGALPEHTLEGYRLAIEQGADAIEPDLVSTRDGVLICRHEPELSTSTDVAERFPERRRVADVDGEAVEGWFAEDFTWDEIATLRARQTWPERPHDHDGAYGVPRFEDVLALVREAERPVGLVPELKHPSRSRALGLPLEPAFLEALQAAGMSWTDGGVVVQSFELDAFERLGRDISSEGPTLDISSEGPTLDVQLVRLWLVGGADALPDDLGALRQQVEAIGVPREAVWGEAGPTGLVERAHAVGLQVYVYTFRTERPGPAGGGDPAAELRAFEALLVDAAFVDQPGDARAALGR
jgi:glycerophosphoryl diester phosphodiesterase